MTPQEIVQEILQLTDDMSKLAERLNELNKLYAMWWQACRGDYKSDKSAEKAWDLTQEGQEMMEIRLKLRVKERKISANKVYLRVLENEARNAY